MKETDVIVLNRAGLHARPASLIAGIAEKSSSAVKLCFGDDCANAKSIMGIISLAATYGTKLTLIVEGPDEEATLKEIAALFDGRFTEQS
ncbi:MAG: HPr family phosphocarrier protein [Spirochaetaceae bacterium]|nr:HPr family phosphocarrier protein [Spirochaetaceae bacterium]